MIRSSWRNSAGSGSSSIFTWRTMWRKKGTILTGAYSILLSCSRRYAFNRLPTGAQGSWPGEVSVD